MEACGTARRGDSRIARRVYLAVGRGLAPAGLSVAPQAHHILSPHPSASLTPSPQGEGIGERIATANAAALASQ